MQPTYAGKSKEYEKAWREHVLLLALAPFISGCGAGMVATVVIQPIDTLKVRMQLMQWEKSAAAASSMSLIRGLIIQRRVAELYNGLSAGLLRVMVYGTTRIGMFTSFESILQQRAAEKGTSLGFGGRAVAGMSAGALAATIGNPTEVALIRMQANGATPGADQIHYRSVFDALRRIIRTEGIAALWAGTAPTVARAMSTNFSQLAFFSETKNQIQRHTNLS